MASPTEVETAIRRSVPCSHLLSCRAISETAMIFRQQPGRWVHTPQAVKSRPEKTAKGDQVRGYCFESVSSRRTEPRDLHYVIEVAREWGGGAVAGDSVLRAPVKLVVRRWRTVARGCYFRASNNRQACVEEAPVIRRSNREVVNSGYRMWVVLYSGSPQGRRSGLSCVPVCFPTHRSSEMPHKPDRRRQVTMGCIAGSPFER